MKSDVLGSLVPKLPKVHQRSSGEPIVGDRPLTRVKATHGIDHFLQRVRGLPVWSASAFWAQPFPSCLPSSRLRGAPAATPTNAARLFLSAVSASHGTESPRRMIPHDGLHSIEDRSDRPRPLAKTPLSTHPRRAGTCGAIRSVSDTTSAIAAACACAAPTRLAVDIIMLECKRSSL